MSFKAQIKEVIIKIIMNNLTEADMNQTEIDSYIKKNAKNIKSCIEEYIENFGDDENKEIDKDWLEDYICTYFN